MRWSVEPFAPAHLTAMVANALGQRELGWHDRRRLEGRFDMALQRAFTVRDAAGRVLFCGGAAEQHPQYVRLWAVYAEGIGPASWGFMLDRTRHFIAGLPQRRIDTLVDAGSTAALRWAEGCGLQREAVMQCAAPDGGDMIVMARIEP